VGCERTRHPARMRQPFVEEGPMRNWNRRVGVVVAAFCLLVVGAGHG